MRALLAGLALVVAAGPAAAAETWVSLFDGRTLTGWTPKIMGLPAGEDPLHTFRAEDGRIVVSYDQYGGAFRNRFGHLFYKAPFSAYRLRMEYRFVGTWPADTPDWAKGNSGVMIHSQAPATMAVDQPFPVSLEVQYLGVVPGQARTTGNLCTPGLNVEMAGKLITRHCNDAISPALPFGEWVRMEVEVSKAGHVVHRINGRDVIAYDAPQYDPADKTATPLIAAAGGALPVTGGYIALQSEGSPIEFRRIEVLEIR
ncbi:DUF1080 domain-containing protein [Phenylobacterium sp.]|uniref:3-keto-disaccharide hydrolase n=1 Tax=Phenylobacterium sp. TaxID=1871053 RepID=UPI0025D21A53|nr:DUF1080 domain-containing protein [Phenylobacterium sp.]MBX3484397.1 DUF1080 domain-containing protein [Phenylobacterium sp.]